MNKFDPNAPVIVDPPAIVRPAQNRAEEVIDQVIKLDRSLATNQFELGDLVAEMIDGDYFHADHCDTLQDFIKKHGFELSDREIAYLVKISRVSRKLDITREQLLKAKISKVKAIFELNPDLDYTDPNTGNTEPMAGIMRSMVTEAIGGKKLKQIKAEVKELKGVTEGEESLIEWLNLPVRKDKRKYIEDTIEIVMKMSGDTIDSDSKEVKDISMATAIERLCADFRSDPNNQIPDEDGDAPESNASFSDDTFIEDEEGNEIETGS